MKIGQIVWEEKIFKVFTKANIRLIAPQSYFKTNQHVLVNLIESHPRNISTQLFENRPDSFGGEDFLNSHYNHITQKSHAPWWHCFSTNQHGSNESDRGPGQPMNISTRLLKSARHSKRRRFF